MAITANRQTSDFSGFITPEMSGPIFEKAARMSVVQRLATRIPLSFKGQTVPVVSGRPVANWVAEGAAKPATQGSMTLKTMSPKKLAAIAVDSMEVVRADPGGYVNRMRDELLPEAFAVAFDYASLHNLGGDGTGTGPFALDDQMETRLLGAVDSTGRPIWVDLPAGPDDVDRVRAGSLVARRSFMGEGVADPLDHILGYAGDWTQAAWGAVGGIDYSISDQATVTINGTLTSLWEHNLVAIRAEAEYGFLVNDVDSFIQLRNDTGS
jgi:hypothetical protein